MRLSGYGRDNKTVRLVSRLLAHLKDFIWILKGAHKIIWKHGFLVSQLQCRGHCKSWEKYNFLVGPALAMETLTAGNCWQWSTQIIYKITYIVLFIIHLQTFEICHAVACYKCLLQRRAYLYYKVCTFIKLYEVYLKCSLN